jgi:hypothetical protein
MANDWVHVFSTKLEYLGKIVEGILEEEGIKSFSINKTDSMHVQLFEADIEIFVQPDDVIRAKHLLEKNEF